MRSCISICACVLTVVLTCVSLDHAREDDASLKHCIPKLISHKSPSWEKIHFRPGEKKQATPVVAFEILASGEVVNARIKRSSGVRDLDRYALESVKLQKYNNRPGCPVVDSSGAITIDFAPN